MQVRRTARAADAVGKLALLRIAVRGALDEGLQQFQRALLARLPAAVPEGLVPARRRLECKTIQRFAGERGWNRRQTQRSLAASQLAEECCRRAPVRTEHA